MCKKTASLSALFALVLISGCDGTERGVLGPTPRGTGPTTVGIQPSLVTVQSISQASCPTVPPFLGSLNLIVQSDGDLGLFVTQVRMTFTDSLGVTAPTVTLPAPVPTQQFGSALVAARADRAFSLTFPFGCGTRRTGTLVVVVVTSDEQGREQTAEARVAVR
jgi:hypothetical protein